MNCPVTAAELRADIARKRITKYKLAGVVGIHPSRISEILNEKKPLTDATAKRIAHALEVLPDIPPTEV